MSIAPVMLRRTLALLSLVAWALACGPDVGVGTPTPEPPDLLRRPDIRIAYPGSTPTEPTDVPIEIVAGAGSVVASSEVWVTNLDDAKRRAPVVVTASAQGSFSATIAAATGDRIRFVARLGERHSLPQDLTVVTIGLMRQLTPSVPEELPCVTLTPREELTIALAREAVGRGVITLENRCKEPILVGPASIRLEGPYDLELPDSVPPGARAEITITSSARSDRERSDVFLLELRAGQARGRYALGLWSIASVIRGN